MSIFDVARTAITIVSDVSALAGNPAAIGGIEDIASGLSSLPATALEDVVEVATKAAGLVATLAKEISGDDPSGVQSELEAINLRDALVSATKTV